jgi:hypothetical protein
MKQSMTVLMLRSASLSGPAFATLAFASLFFGTGGIAMADNTQPVAVGVYAQHAGGKIAYHYRVVNYSQQNITAVTIGRDNQNDGNPNNDVNELHELPSGWNAKLGIPSTSANSPTGWRVSVIAPEENQTHAIAWEIMNDRSPMLLAGQTTNKMSISLDNADTNYLTAHALITYADGDPINLTVPVERLDHTPPNFTVNLSPNTILPQSNKLVAINASFTVKDNYDTMPEIRLVSITANEPLGTDDIRDASFGLDDRYFKLLAESKSTFERIYTVTYSATDASGNQTTASATVTVTKAMTAPMTTPVAPPAPMTIPAAAPHDQGEVRSQ